jgi:alkylated DNA repair dioxygenase AlkB
MLMLLNNEIIIDKDGSLALYPTFLDVAEANFYKQHFLEHIHWQQYDIRIFGRSIPQPRLSAWYGDEGAAYAYSGISLAPLPFTPELLQLKQRIEAQTQQRFNSVLLNLYRHQNDSMGWHSDDEKELGTNPFIASISLGSNRTFLVKHKQQKSLKGKLDLCHGSLLCMGGSFQAFWQHAVPKIKVPCGPRINLTFRQIIKR